MKRPLIVFCLLLFSILIISSCGNHDSIPKDFIANLKNCMKQCDDLETKYEREDSICLYQCSLEFYKNLDSCKKHPESLLLCLERAFAIRRACDSICTLTWKGHMDEIKKCREECMNHTEIKQ